MSSRIPMRIPTATYRIQFCPSFGFRDAKGVVEYLTDLGITDLYSSPIFAARPGSQHGYDVVDSNRFNSELGTVEEFDSLIKEMQRHRMGWLQDIVPNHMAYDSGNSYLMDVFELGRDSRFSNFFDIDWDPPEQGFKNRVIAPFLGTAYREALHAGEIRLVYEEDGFRVRYYGLCFPLKIETYGDILSPALDLMKKQLGGEHPDGIRLEARLRSFQGGSLDHEKAKNLKAQLWQDYSKISEIRQFVDAAVDGFNDSVKNAGGRKSLDLLLGRQVFLLTHWKTANHSINYRRFFTINELISLKVEAEGVLDQTHALIFSLCQGQKINAVRIDHIDGLFDPADYLRHLRERVGDLYLVVEKILDREEDLPGNWPVQGTTGYDFLNSVTGLYCNRAHEEELDSLYKRFTGKKAPPDQLIYQNKKHILETYMRGDLENLAHHLGAIARKDRQAEDLSRNKLKRAIAETIACLPVYRTYVRQMNPEDPDVSIIKGAVSKARQLNPGFRAELDFLERVLLLRVDREMAEDLKRRWLQFGMRFQQLSGPLMAKGLEDTTLYVYHRLLSINDVGGSPAHFGTDLDEWHEFNLKRFTAWPHTMNASATHDTKRGEDVRARINVLSEIPKEWEKWVLYWHKLNRSRKVKIGRRRVPDKNVEYFLYQTLVGAFPFDGAEYGLFAERIKQYLIKAEREAKVHTDWLIPDSDYEKALTEFIEAILSETEDNLFLKDLRSVQKKVASYAALNSLSQTLIKITAPGVPDFYQGTELWDLSLVDPDNRRPVDFEKRRRLLTEIRGGAQQELSKLLSDFWSKRGDGRIKLFLIYRALQARRSRRELFETGTYLPVRAEGRFAEHVVAFGRNYKADWAITIAPRFFTALASEGEMPLGPEVWKDTQLKMPEGGPPMWEEVITGQLIANAQSLSLGDLLKSFPTALLIGRIKE